MSRSVIRRQYRCTACARARRARSPSSSNSGSAGSTILALELQGALFFGSGERLAARDRSERPQDTRYVVLDLRRVSEIDSTGAQILLDIHAELAAHGQHLLLSLTQTSEAAAQLEESGVAEAVGEPHMFPDLDRALEWAEDELLRADGVQAEDQPELPLGGTSAAAGFTAAELALLEKELERRTYRAGQHDLP